MDGYVRSKFNQIFNIEEWDYIFVCNSPHWFPPDYDVFFEMSICIYENITGIKVSVNKDVFCPNGLSVEYPYDI